MKLIEIWNAQDIFRHLASLRKPPKLAYRLMKYERKFTAEMGVCETQRGKCVCEVADVEYGSPAADQIALTPGSPEFEAFLAKFNEFLQNESELEPMDMQMDALVDALAGENALSENDLAILEPFFRAESSLALVPQLEAAG